MKDANRSGNTPRIVVAYCRNAMSSAAELLEGPYAAKGFNAFFAALPCSSKIEPSYPMKILADGADGVLVVACPDNHCRFMVGNVRAEKRIDYVRDLLDKAKMGAERLFLERGENLTEKGLLDLAQRRLGPLKTLGANPMKGGRKMIIAEWKPLPELVEMLKGHTKVLVVGCATCVAECAAGGEREVETLAPLLQMALKNEGHTISVVTRTSERQCEWEFVEELADVATQVDAVVSIACGIGIQAVAERFPDLAVYPGVNTTALAIRQEPGTWIARCAACGDCVLGDNFGLCPVARCAKSLSNGPCGGTRIHGKCEVDENIDCVWFQIYERAKSRGKVEQLLKVRKPKNWSNSGHGGPKRVVREDLRP